MTISIAPLFRPEACGTAYGLLVGVARLRHDDRYDRHYEAQSSPTQPGQLEYLSCFSLVFAVMTVAVVAMVIIVNLVVLITIVAMTGLHSYGLYSYGLL